MAEPITLDIDTGGLERSMREGPATVYFWMRQWLFRSMLEHRLQWLKRKGPRFGRGKDAIRVWPINKAPSGAIDPKWVVYRVSPSQKSFRNQPAKAARALPKLGAEAFAGSVVLDVHQTGKDIDVGSKWLAIPVRKGPRSPKRWRKRWPNRILITIPDAGNPDRLFLVERKRYRGRRQSGRQARNRRKKVVRDKLITRFVLVHRLDMHATLNFYETWDALSSARQKDFASVSTRILQDIARGKR